jgi:predicted N-formylglutamate amidohydrolase
LTDSTIYLVTCEHGGNRVPSRYRPLFRGHEALLHTHRGYDAGALRVARELACMLSAPLIASTTSRLLIDLNRSPRHPKLYSEATRAASRATRDEIFQNHYLPYRTRVENLIADAIAAGSRVVHFSSHTFTPELNSIERNTDIGLLYDPARPAESELCRRWKSALNAGTSLKTRMNYPYAGTADGLTVFLRRRFPADSYLGIELEINQKHVRQGSMHWGDVRRAVIEALCDVTDMTDVTDVTACSQAIPQPELPIPSGGSSLTGRR